MEVLDASGAVIFRGATGARDVQEFTNLFRAPVDGQYYVRVIGTGTGEYSVIVTDDLSYGLPNGEAAGAQQQLIPGTSMLGFAAAHTPPFDIEATESNDTLATAADPMLEGGYVHAYGHIHAEGDVDMIYLGYFQEGDTLEIDVDLPHGGDSYIRIFGSWGSEWAYNDDGHAPDDFDEHGNLNPNEIG